MPKNNAGDRLVAGKQNNEGEISDNSDKEILSSKMK
jgi:timeless